MRRHIFLLVSLIAVSVRPDAVEMRYNPSYSGTLFHNSTLVIQPTGKSIVEYKGSGENEFGSGEKQMLIIQYFLSEFPKCLASISCFKLVTMAKPEQNQSLKYASFGRVGEKKRRFAVPETRGPSAFGMLDADVTLVLDSLVIMGSGVIAAYPSGLGLSTGVGISSNRRLLIAAKVVFWDNRTMKPIAYGTVEAITPASFAITLSTWEKAISYFSQLLIKDGQFSKWHNDAESSGENSAHFSTKIANSTTGQLEVHQKNFKIKYMSISPDNMMTNTESGNELSTNVILKPVGFIGENLRPFIKINSSARRQLNVFTTKRISLVLGSITTGALVIVGLATGFEKEKTGTTYSPDINGNWGYHDTYKVHIQPHFKIVMPLAGVLALYSLYCGLTAKRNLRQCVNLYNENSR